MGRGRSTDGKTASPRPRLWLSFLVLSAIGVLLVLHANVYDFVSDDAFIVARYARNVVEGHGWVYNVGERVEGYTSFLWVGLTALLGLTGVDYVNAARALSLVGLVSCIPVMYLAAPLLGIRRRSPLAFVGPLLLTASAPAVCWALGGLEACGYALSVFATVFLAAGERRDAKRLALAGVVCGASTLLRPEGVIVAVGLAAWLIPAGRRGAWRALPAFLIPVVIVAGSHLLWRYFYYGDWLPNTFYAKVGTSLDQLQRGLRYVLAFVADNGGLVVWLTPFVAVWLYEARPFVRAVSLVGLLLVVPVILVGGDGLPMYRFMVPLVPLWALLAQALTADILGYRRRVASGLLPWKAVALSVLVVVCLIVSLVSRPQGLNQYFLYKYQQSVEVPRWTAAGKWLAENAPPDASIACVPIGAVGYYSQLHVYDMMGLTDKHIARKPIDLGKGWPGHEKHDGPYILSKEPTYLLLGNIQVITEKLPLDSPYFVRPQARDVRRCEEDIFLPNLFRKYERRVVELPDGLYFHFLQRRSVQE